MRRMVSSLLAVVGLAIVAVAPARSANLTTLVTFCMLPNCADGSGPEASLIADANGNLFGTTTNMADFRRTFTARCSRSPALAWSFPSPSPVRLERRTVSARVSRRWARSLAGSMPLPQRRDSPALGRCSIIRSNPGTPPRIDFLIQPNRIWTFCSIFRKESLRRFTYTQTKRSFFRNEYPAYVGRVWQKGVNLV